MTKNMNISPTYNRSGTRQRAGTTSPIKSGQYEEMQKQYQQVYV